MKKIITVTNPATGQAIKLPAAQVRRKIAHTWGLTGRELAAALHDCRLRSELYFT